MDYMREYFYTIDKNGLLYHDGAELRDQKFLNFFFRQLKSNNTGSYEEYSYISPCGKEMNYVKCYNRPIVFHKYNNGNLIYASGLEVPLKPDRLRFSDDGLLYHPAPVGEFGTFSSKLMLDFGELIQPWGPYYSIKIDKSLHVIEPLTVNANLQLIRPREDNVCFGCGRANKIGLALSFLYNENNNSTFSWLVPDTSLEGAPGWMHGGFISLLLDEIMAKVLTGMKVKAPTANLNVHFRKPCRIGIEIELSANLKRKNGRKYQLYGSIHTTTDNEVKELLADAEGLFIEAKVGGL